MVNDKAMTQADLARLQERQFELALRVRAICDKNAIPYFLIAGTLLGAVRHKGFIPWDDDLDIGMLRRDYDRFIELAQYELGSDYFVQTYHTDPDMPLPFAKVRINGTVLRELGSRDCKWHPGIFIDIFPFDGVPANRALRWLHKSALFLFSRALLTACHFDPLAAGGSTLKRITYKALIAPVAWALPRRLQVKAIDRLARMFSGAETDRVMATGGAYGYDSETIRRDWVLQQVPLDFGTSTFSCPVRWHDYLTNLYRDYMQLPPVESRYNRHGIIEIDFGKEKR